jgi:hypothetical protein
MGFGRSFSDDDGPEGAQLEGPSAAEMSGQSRRHETAKVRTIGELEIYVPEAMVCAGRLKGPPRTAPAGAGRAGRIRAARRQSGPVGIYLRTGNARFPGIEGKDLLC